MGAIRKSFYDWCIENNHQDWVDLWDYELNNISPKNIGFSTMEKYYFRCKKGIHKSELKNIYCITHGKSYCLKCKQCNSFAQYLIDTFGENALKLYWDYDKNSKTPWDYSKQSDRRVWVKCQKHDYHGTYQVSCEDFVNGQRCPYCHSVKVHIKDSFAQWNIDNTDKDFLKKYWSDKNTLNPWKISFSNNKYVWIKCQEKDYHEDYKVTCAMFVLGFRCPYCKHKHGKVHKLDSLGTLYPEVLNIWSDKNKKSPYQYSPLSNQKVLWKCPDGKHEDYLRSINNSNRFEFRCPDCVRERDESFLQEKVRTYIENAYSKYMLNHEYNCTLLPQNPHSKRPLPFDNEVIINDTKLIIEVHGIQHYKMCSYKSIWRNKKYTPEEQFHKQQLHDRYKRYIAFVNGYFYLAIPYTADDKKETYKKMIDDKINEMLNQRQVVNN